MVDKILTKQKVHNIIDSCETFPHTETAYNYIKLFHKVYEDEISYISLLNHLENRIINLNEVLILV